ncbi:hypothetical protein Lepto1548_16975 [Leptospira interrogans serovar Bataviae]|nr:hypothetical protein Lepto1548_16975 [Leptospira interrogans serovar Bataviae]
MNLLRCNTKFQPDIILKSLPVPKPQGILCYNSLEIFNKTQWFLQIRLHLAICKLSNNLISFNFRNNSHVLFFVKKLDFIKQNPTSNSC